MTKVYGEINTALKEVEKIEGEELTTTSPIIAAANNLADQWQEKKSEVVVSGAVMCCSMAPTDKGDYNEYRRLMIPDDTYFEGWKVDQEEGSPYFNSIKVLDASTCGGPGGKIAHDHHCVAEVNIHAFSSCKKNDHYFKRYQEIISYKKKHLKEMQEQVDAMPDSEEKAVLIFKKKKLTSEIKTLEENLYFTGQNPCILQFLDKWFGASDAIQVSNMYACYQRILYNINVMKTMFESLTNYGNQISNVNPTVIEEKRVDKTEFSEKREQLEQATGELEEALVSFWANVYGYQGVGESPVDITVWTLKISECLRYFDSIDILPAYQATVYRNPYPLWRDTISPDIGNLWNTLNNLPGGIATHSVLTTNSYLVCRMGGYISFVNSGQVPLLMENLLPMAVRKIIQHAIDQLEQEKDNGLSSGDIPHIFNIQDRQTLSAADETRLIELNEEKAQEYRDAILYLKHILNLLELDEEPAGDIPKNVTVELWLWPRKDLLEAVAKEKAQLEATLLLLGLVPHVGTAMAVANLIFWAVDWMRSEDGSLPENTANVGLDTANEIGGKVQPVAPAVPGMKNAAGQTATDTQNAAAALNIATLFIASAQIAGLYLFEAGDVFNVCFGMTINTPHHSFTMEAAIDQQGAVTNESFKQKPAYSNANNRNNNIRLKLPMPTEEWQELFEEIGDDTSLISLQYNIDSVNNKVYYGEE